MHGISSEEWHAGRYGDIDSLNHEILMEQMFLSAKARGAERRQERAIQ